MDNNTNRGRPQGLNSIELDEPQIWSSVNKCACIPFLRLLQRNGRHVLLQKHNSKNEVEMKQYYTQIERISKQYFHINSTSRRCVVFFFRQPGEPKFIEIPELVSERLHILQYVTCLLNAKFINEVINIITSSQSPQEIAINLLKEKPLSVRNKKCEMLPYSQIVQNAFISYILQQMKNQKRIIRRTKSDILQCFKKFLQSSEVKQKVESFIKELRESLMFSAEHDEEPNEKENAQQNEQQFTQNCEPMNSLKAGQQKQQDEQQNTEMNLEEEQQQQFQFRKEEHLDQQLYQQYNFDIQECEVEMVSRESANYVNLQQGSIWDPVQLFDGQQNSQCSLLRLDSFPLDHPNE